MIIMMMNIPNYYTAIPPINKNCFHPLPSENEADTLFKGINS
jgi:hypothetical protein